MVVREPIVAAREVGVVPDVLNEAGVASGHGYDVIVDVQIADLIRTVSATAAVLLNPGDAVGVVDQLVAVHLNIRRGRHHDAGAPQPGGVPRTVALDIIVADHCVIGDLVENANPRVVHHPIPLIEGVDVVDVGPQPGPEVVMGVIVAYYEVSGLGELGAATFPAPLVAGIVVVGNLVVFNQQAIAVPAQSQLPVVMYVIANDLGTIGCLDPHAMVVSDLVVGNEPVGSIVFAAGIVASVDRPHLGRIGIFFDNQAGDRDAIHLPLESDLSYRRLDTLS